MKTRRTAKARPVQVAVPIPRDELNFYADGLNLIRTSDAAECRRCITQLQVYIRISEARIAELELMSNPVSFN